MKQQTSDFYVTTFCNRAHRKRDGRPINHECYILRPESLKLEIDGKMDEIEKMHDGIIMRRGCRS